MLMGKVNTLTLTERVTLVIGRRENFMVKEDWYMKYPNMPKIDAVISWSDDQRHKGTIYKSSNFQETGKSGGNSHGNGKRKDSGNYLPHKGFKNIKTRFLYRFDDLKETENTWWEN